MMTIQEKIENFPNGIRLNPDPSVPVFIDVSEDQQAYVFEQEVVYQGKKVYMIDKLFGVEVAQYVFDSLLSF